MFLIQILIEKKNTEKRNNKRSPEFKFDKKFKEHLHVSILYNLFSYCFNMCSI